MPFLISSPTLCLHPHCSPQADSIRVAGACLQESVARACGSASGLLDDLLGCCQGLELLTAAGGLGLEVGCLGHAVVVQIGKRLHVLGKVLG